MGVEWRTRHNSQNSYALKRMCLSIVRLLSINCHSFRRHVSLDRDTKTSAIATKE
jgi:hypothetical protein